MPLSFDDSGAAPGRMAVLLVHGAVQTRAVWQAQAAALSADYRVVVPDLRGHGSSPLGDGTPSIAGTARDCLALLDRLDIEDVVVCGVSLGGMVALEIAVRAPHRIRGLVLANTPRALSSNRLIRRLVDALGPHRLLPLAFRLLGRRGAAEAGLAMARRLVGPHWVGKTARHHFIRGFVTMREEAIVATYRSIVEAEPADLSAVLCPILLVDGVNDAPSIRDQMGEIAEEALRARLEVIEAGHVATLDDPDGFNRLLRAFLERHAPKADTGRTS